MINSTKFSKIIALSVGVLAMVFLVNYIVLAVWQEPSQAPPEGNVLLNLHTVTTRGSTTTNSVSVNILTVGYGQTSGKIYMADAAGEEGDIYRADQIYGLNDLRLGGDADFTGEADASSDLYINSAGDVSLPNGNLTVGGTLTVNTAGGNVCLSDGTNCPTTTAPNLDSVLAQGNSSARPAILDSDGNETTIVGGNLDVGVKLTVPTIDPRYEINGKTYAAYVLDYAGGVRTETSGILKLENSMENWKKVIDFNQLEEGSDLWLFWETSNQNLDDLVVILTPGFEGKVWYQKEGDKLMVYGEEEGEVSYRLTAPRKDWQEHPNLLTKNEK